MVKRYQKVRAKSLVAQLVATSWCIHYIQVQINTPLLGWGFNDQIIHRKRKRKARACSLSTSQAPKPLTLQEQLDTMKPSSIPISAYIFIISTLIKTLSNIINTLTFSKLILTLASFTTRISPTPSTRETHLSVLVTGSSPAQIKFFYNQLIFPPKLGFD